MSPNLDTSEAVATSTQPASRESATANNQTGYRKDVVATPSLEGPRESKKERKRRLAQERNKTHVQERERLRKQIADDKKRELDDREERKAIAEELHRAEIIPMDSFPHGYPLQAAFQSSDPGFSIYRAFGYLHARVILQLQDELRALEDTLAELDADDFEFGRKGRLTSRDFDMEEARKAFKEKCAREKISQNNERSVATQENGQTIGPLSERAVLLEQIRVKLLEYDEMVIKGREMVGFQRPSDRDWQSFRNWFWNKKPLSYEREEEFIRRKGDLITLQPRAEWGKFDDWIKACISNMPKLVECLFREDQPKGDTRDSSASYYSITRIEKFTTLIITFVIVTLLAVPVFVMYRVSWKGGRGMTFLNVGLLIVFALFFSASMSLLTRAKRAELFAASAAYSAVLIVFIGTSGQSVQAAT